MKLPLEGLRILAVEQYGAGPYGSGHLADMGAEVIKIEHRASGGDMARGVGPYFLGEHDSEFFQTFNRNKKSLDARPQARARARGVRAAGRDRRRGVRQHARRPAREAAPALRRPEGDQPADRVRPPVGLRLRRLAQGLAGLRFPGPGGVRLSFGDRGAGQPPCPLWPVHGRLHDRDDGRLRPDVRPARGARDRGRPRRRGQSLRRRHPPAELPGDLVPERGPGDDAAAALGPSLSRPLAALPHAGRLDLLHVPDPALLGAPVRQDRPARADR